jgi:hypothetical protein
LLSVHPSREAEEIVFRRLGDGDRHVHASRHIRHREGDDGLGIGVRQVAEAIGDLDRYRREIKILGDERDLVRLFERKTAALRVAVLSSARAVAPDSEERLET